MLPFGPELGRRLTYKKLGSADCLLAVDLNLQNHAGTNLPHLILEGLQLRVCFP